MFKNTFINTTLIQSIRHPGRPSGRQPQAGFIQGVLLFGIALLAVVIAAFSFSNKSSSNSTAAEEAKTYASTIIAHGNALKTAADRFRADRGDLSSMTFDGGTITNGLFNTADAFITSGTLVIQPQAFLGGTTPGATVSATKNAHFYLKSAGASTISVDSTSMSMIATTGPLTQATCQRINTNLHRTTTINTATAGSNGAFRGGSSSSDAITIPAFTGVTNLEEGCVKSSGGEYYYFKVLQRV